MRGGFTGHAGYDGLILGTPAGGYEIEFTSHASGSPCPAPSQDNLLVFYLADARELAAVTARMSGLGYVPVPPENPYWETRGQTFVDPDGWMVVVVDQTSLG